MAGTPGPTEPLAQLLTERWGFRQPRVEPLGGGMNSETFLVQHEGSTYVAKRVAPEALDELVRGCEAALLLAERGFVTGRPSPTVEGELVVITATGPVALLEHVPGRELEGGTAEEQDRIARTLAGVHVAGGPARSRATASFFAWLSPDIPGVAATPWLRQAVHVVREETDELDVTWSLLHTDPAPEAFRHEESSGVTGLVDWTGATRGPVLYDVASAVMYLGGTACARVFLETYRRHGPLADEELQHLDAFCRFRWAVQGAYFAGRLAARDLTGITAQHDNEKGLADAERGLAELGAGGA